MQQKKIKKNLLTFNLIMPIKTRITLSFILYNTQK
jgi:hypothetical protein